MIVSTNKTETLQVLISILMQGAYSVEFIQANETEYAVVKKEEIVITVTNKVWTKAKELVESMKEMDYKQLETDFHEAAKTQD